MHRTQPHNAAPLVRTRLALALLLGTAACASQAQSLVELYNAARSYDATYQSAKAQFDATQFKAAQADALWLPSVGLQAGLTRHVADATSQSESVTRADGSTVSASGSATTSNTGQTNKTLALSLSQNLFNRANSYTIAQAQHSVEIASQTLRAAEQDLVVRISQAYFDVLAATDSVAYVRNLKAATAEQLASAKRNFEVGTATIVDTRDAQARYDLVSAQELAATNDLQVKRSNLAQLVGRADVAPVPLKPNATLSTTEEGLDAWLQRTELAPLVAIRKTSLEVARLETSKAKAGHLPTVALTASYAKSFPDGRTDALTGLTNRLYGGETSTSSSSWAGDSTSASLGVTVNVPLFTGFAVQNRMKETLSLETQAESDYENARRIAAQATRTAYFGVQSGLSQVKAYEAAETSSQSALDSNKLGYQVGVKINIDVLNSQSQLYDTKAKLSKARYDVLVGGLKLRQAAGTLSAADLEPINAQLSP